MDCRANEEPNEKLEILGCEGTLSQLKFISDEEECWSGAYPTAHLVPDDPKRVSSQGKSFGRDDLRPSISNSIHLFQISEH